MKSSRAGGTRDRMDRDAVMREAQSMAVSTRYGDVFGSLMFRGRQVWAQAGQEMFQRGFRHSLLWLAALSALGVLVVRLGIPGRTPFIFGLVVLLPPAALLYNVAVRRRGLYAHRVWGTFTAGWLGCWGAGFVINRLVAGGVLPADWLDWQVAAPAVLTGGLLLAVVLLQPLTAAWRRAFQRWSALAPANYALGLGLCVAVMVELAHGAATGVPPLAAAPFGGLEALSRTLSGLD